MRISIKVIGPTGSGKSLLIKEIQELLEPKGWLFTKSVYNNKTQSEEVRGEKGVRHV